MSDTILQCMNLKKTYPRLSLDLDFSVSSGELVSIIGPSGSGKSTVLKLIGGIISPDSGTIAIDGNDVTALGTDRRGTAMIFRDFALFPHMNVE